MVLPVTDSERCLNIKNIQEIAYCGGKNRNLRMSQICLQGGLVLLLSSVTLGKLTSMSLIGLIPDLGTIIITLYDCYKGNMKSNYNSIEFTVF